MQQNQQRLSQLCTNPRARKSPTPKVNEKEEKTMIAKRKYKVRVLTQPAPSTPTSTAPNPMVATISMQTPMVRSTAESIPVTIHKLAMGQFAEVSNPMTRSLNDNTNPPPLEDIPSTPFRQGTPWPKAGSASENLFETRKDWPIPPTPVPTPTPAIKTEEQPKTAAIPCTMTMPKQTIERCSCGPHCPICKNEEEHREEDWDGNLQNQP